MRELAAGLGGLLQGRKALDGFESELKAFLGVRHCYLVSSGKAALTLILLALKDLAPGRNGVILPAFTCYSVPSSALRAGLDITLCDLAADSLDLDSTHLCKLLASAARAKPLAVVSTHLYGYSSNVARIRKLVGDGPIAIIEDAAQALGETADGGNLGTLGDVGFFSLGRGKALSTVEGGIILTNRDDIGGALRARVEALPRYGGWSLLGLVGKAVALMTLIHPLVFWIPRALPFLRLGETLFETDFPIRRMSAFQAGLARAWQERLKTMRFVRKTNSSQWLVLLEELGARSAAFSSTECPAPVRFPLRIRDADRRNALLRESEERGAGISPAYPRPINRLAELEGRIPPQDCPAAERYARELVTLPTHAYLLKKDFALIKGLLTSALSSTNDSAAQSRAAVRDSASQSGMKPS